MADDKKNSKMTGGMTCDCGTGCACGCSKGGGRHWTFFLLRTLVTILILMMVFWFGVMTARIGMGYYGDRGTMMRGYGMGVYNGGAGMGMPMIRVNGPTSTNATDGM